MLELVYGVDNLGNWNIGLLMYVRASSRVLRRILRGDRPCGLDCHHNIVHDLLPVD
jgi:hypothetical protein